jgi:predicted permease
VVGRLKPGVTRAQAQAEMGAIARKLAHDYPKTNAERSLRVAPFLTDSEGDIGHAIIWMIMDLALAVLMIACVNLANLQLVRMTARSREIAIRLALGSSRLRVMGMLLSESILLSLCGGALGLLFAKWANDYVGAYFNLPVPLDYRVLAFAFVASAATGAVFGTVPAWIASRADVNATLKQGGRGASAGGSRNRLRQVLIVAQLAIALVLLTGAGYFIRGIHRIMNHEMGWDPDHLTMGEIELPNAKYGERGDKRTLVFAEKLISGLRHLPGVQDAAISTGTPIGTVPAGDPFAVEGRPAPAKGAEPLAYTNRVTPGFFATHGMHVLRGRDFAISDRPGAPNVAIVSKSLAEKFWPGEDPIGKRIGGTDPVKPDWSEVVGVVNDVVGSIRIARYETPYQIYRPWFQDTFRFLIFSVRTGADPHSVVEGARKALADVEPDIAATILAPARDTMEDNMSGIVLVQRMLDVMALLGLLLSTIGIYGVVANVATERTQEIGVRMALGAGSADVQWLFMRSGIILAVLGSGIGLLASVGLVMALDRLVQIVPGNDPWVIAGVGVMLAVIALLACWIPAWRATKVDPTVSLRAE